MIQKIKKIINLLKNMGFRYFFFRIYYAAITKLGWQKRVFPTKPEYRSFITLKEWKANLPPFFFHGKNICELPKLKSDHLKVVLEGIKKGDLVFFNRLKFNLGTNYDWLTNPITDFKYNTNKHWSEIQDISKEAGDIKFVWEKARFCYLYDIIRYDYHFDDDQSELVFSEIEDFIDKNPINLGPNYICSQETSLRLLNWTFALYYYKDSKNLTEGLFSKMMNAIYWQVHHIYNNIHFSRIAVRNNHAITETLMLCLSNLLFPFIPDTEKWSKKGKKWFEDEIEYQIYSDGTYLQFSMNYHRVVVQLLTWAIRLAQLNNNKFANTVYDRAEKSLRFLDSCLNKENGSLPNYGSNDGALFFKLTSDDYRNYKSQLDDLRVVLGNKVHYASESHYWYGIKNPEKVEHKQPEIAEYKQGGYFIINENNSKTFIRCGAYKDRPAQSDNLHLDIWVNGANVLRDSGSYKYNTEKEIINYFNGCEGHNTISVSKENQMLKGNRFIWFNWVKYANASLIKSNGQYEFKGSIKGFKNLGNNIYHHRKVVKEKSINTWNVIDKVDNKGDKDIYQYWHIDPNYFDRVSIRTKDERGEFLEPLLEEKWYSGYYGIKEKSIRLTFRTNTNSFNTEIRIDL